MITCITDATVLSVDEDFTIHERCGIRAGVRASEERP
jgi:hypothetical protein